MSDKVASHKAVSDEVVSKESSSVEGMPQEVPQWVTKELTTLQDCDVFEVIRRRCSRPEGSGEGVPMTGVPVSLPVPVPSGGTN